MPETIKQIVGVIKQVRREADEGRDGPEIDLCNILLLVIKQWKEKGRDWVLNHYWVPNPDKEIANWRHKEE